MSSHAALAHKPTFIQHPEHPNARFLIMDAPTDQNLSAYIEECKKYNVQYIVRACEKSYSTAPLAAAGITVEDMPFPDGDPPPEHVVKAWLDLADKQFVDPDEKRTLGVHCVAGLGRAPVLVAISLIEQGLDALDVVAFIRKKRRGAINARQLKFLESYEPRAGGGGCCVIL